MARASFDVISASRRLQDAGFGAEQAEAVVQTMIQANSLTLQMVQDLADLKAHVTENMVTKAYLAETLSQYDLKNMATKSDFKDVVSRIQFEETVSRLATKDDIRNMATKDATWPPRTISATWPPRTISATWPPRTISTAS